MFQCLKLPCTCVARICRCKWVCFTFREIWGYSTSMIRTLYSVHCTIFHKLCWTVYRTYISNKFVIEKNRVDPTSHFYIQSFFNMYNSHKLCKLRCYLNNFQNYCSSLIILILYNCNCSRTSNGTLKYYQYLRLITINFIIIKKSLKKNTLRIESQKRRTIIPQKFRTFRASVKWSSRAFFTAT